MKKDYKKMYNIQNELISDLDKKIEKLKRDDRNIWIPWSSIGMISIIILLVYILVSSYPSDKFTIYKTECHNQLSPIEDIGLCMSSCEKNNPKAFKNFSCWDICFMERKVCNQIEVDYITNIGNVVSCPKNQEEKNNCKDGWCPCNIVRKSDLNREWLNNNCDLFTIYNKTNYYQCGEYYVEVK